MATNCLRFGILGRKDSGQVNGRGRAVGGSLLHLFLATGHVATDDGHTVVVEVEHAGGPEQAVPRTHAGIAVDHVLTGLVTRAHRRGSSSIESRLTLTLTPILSKNDTDEPPRADTTVFIETSRIADRGAPAVACRARHHPMPRRWAALC